jgi:hypothetical protein
MVAVMGDVFALVYNFHSLLSSKVKLSIQRGCKLMFLISRCWSVGYILIMWCYVYSGLVPIGVYLFSFAMLWCVSASGRVLFWCHCVSCPFEKQD